MYVCMYVCPQCCSQLIALQACSFCTPVFQIVSETHSNITSNTDKIQGKHVHNHFLALSFTTSSPFPLSFPLFLHIPFLNFAFHLNSVSEGNWEHVGLSGPIIVFFVSLIVLLLVALASQLLYLRHTSQCDLIDTVQTSSKSSVCYSDVPVIKFYRNSRISRSSPLLLAAVSNKRFSQTMIFFSASKIDIVNVPTFHQQVDMQSLNGIFESVCVFCPHGVMPWHISGHRLRLFQHIIFCSPIVVARPMLFAAISCRPPPHAPLQHPQRPKLWLVSLCHPCLNGHGNCFFSLFLGGTCLLWLLAISQPLGLLRHKS